MTTTRKTSEKGGRSSLLGLLARTPSPTDLEELVGGGGLLVVHRAAGSEFPHSVLVDGVCAHGRNLGGLSSHVLHCCLEGGEVVGYLLHAHSREVEPADVGEVGIPGWRDNSSKDGKNKVVKQVKQEVVHM